MGLFDYFSKEAAQERKRNGCLKKLTNMYYQPAERYYAADVAAELVAGGDKEAIHVLLTRFEHIAPSSTNDQEEKKYVHDKLVGLGEPIVETLQQYILTTDKAVYWPMRVLGSLWTRSRFEEFLAEVLTSMDPEYVRNPEKKIGLMRMAADHPNPVVAEALKPFLADTNETVRYQTVEALVDQGDKAEGLYEAFLPRLVDEESLRIVNRIGELFAEKGWSLEGADTEAVRNNLGTHFRLSKDGKIERV